MKMHRAKSLDFDYWGKDREYEYHHANNRYAAVILTSDHGTNVGDREGHPFGKSTPPRENESHVPLMMYTPDAGKGRCDAFCQPQDLFATIMGLIGKSAPEGIESHDLLKLAKGKSAGQRRIALAGQSIKKERWNDPDKVLFSVFDKDWRLGVAADPGKCELQRLGSIENVAAGNPEVVEQLRSVGLDEIARRGLDPALTEWIKSEGKNPFPEKYRITDAHPRPSGWEMYGNNLYHGK